jgi:hypothetical protein
MMRRWGLAAAAACVLGLLVVEALAGFSDSFGLYIQEYWQDGVPKFAIYNANADSLNLTVRRLVRGKTSHDLAVVKQDTLATWHLPPQSVTLVPAVGVSDSLRSGEQLFGVCGPYDTIRGFWTETGMPPAAAVRGIALYTGPGAPGHRSREAWVREDRLWHESGEEFTLDVALAGGSGVLEIPREKEWPLTPVEILGARSATLKVTDLGRAIEIDALNIDRGDSLHHILVKCIAPEVDRPAMTCFVAILKGVDPDRPEQGFSHDFSRGLYRGILVRPREARSVPPAN